MLTLVPKIGVSISGINTLESAIVAANNGAGIKFFFDKKSPKYIEPSKANIISKIVSKKVGIAGVFVNPTNAELKECLSEIDLEYIQLNGNESQKRVHLINLNFSYHPHHETNRESRKIKRRIIKAIPVTTKKDLDKIKLYENVSDGLLYDTNNSEIIDWSMFNEIYKWANPLSNKYTGKQILPRFYGTISGKFNEKNIKPALKTGTKGIDISSGLENEMGEISTEKINSLFKYLNKNELLHGW